MIDLKQAIIGTDATGGDPRKLLLESGVQSFRLQGGYVAPVLTQDDGLPLIKFGRIDIEALFVEWDDIDDDGKPEYRYAYVGDLQRIIAETRLCCECNHNIENFYYPHIRLYTNLDDGELCECCGKVFEGKPIPF